MTTDINGGGGKSATAYLTRGAHIRCQYGTHGRYLNLPVDHGVYASGHPVMHEKDCVLGKHISSFGICRSCHNPDRSKITMASETGGMITGTPCRPRLNGKWLGTVAATTVGEGQTAYNALSTASFLPCYQGAGLIAPQNSGQQRTGIVTASVQRQVVGELRGITIEDSPVPLAGAMVVATNALAANSSKDMVDLLEENLPSVKDTFVANGETYYNLQEIFSLLGGTVTIGDKILGSIADVNGNALRLEGTMYTLPWYAVEKHVASVVDITTYWAGVQNVRGEFDSMFIQIKAKAKKVYATKSELMKWFKIAFRHEGNSGGGAVAIPEQVVEDMVETISINDWLIAYSEPSASGGRIVKPVEVETTGGGGWYSEENQTGLNYYVRQQGDFTVNLVNGVMTDEKGRYWIAVGPRVLDPNYPADGKVESDDFVMGTAIDVKLQHRTTGKIVYVRCVVGELKAHTYPNGITQTGVAYPNSYNARVGEDGSGNKDGSTVEFMGSINRGENMSQYELVELIVYGRI